MEREHGAGLRFGRYQTLFRLGTGGMAEVFVARQLGEARFERLVALKRPLAHLARDSRYTARFLDEARLGACVQHPNVVQTLDVGANDEGDPFLVLELVVGMSLDRVLKAGALPWEVCVVWLAEAASGLHAAHQAQRADGAALLLVHRDVSPHNVLIGSDGVARIGDFGIAQAALLKDAQTQTGVVAGKLAYFSPEQARGEPLDARSDVFSLGIVAWEALTGQRLFAADALGEVLDRVRSLTPAAPHTLVPGIPRALSQLVLKALERDRAARFQTAREFALALHAAGAQRAASRAACVALLTAREDKELQSVRARLFRAQSDAPPAPAKPRSAAVRPKLALLGLLLLLLLGISARLLSSRAAEEDSARPARDLTTGPASPEHAPEAPSGEPSPAQARPEGSGQPPSAPSALPALRPANVRAKKTRPEPSADAKAALPPPGLLGLDAFERTAAPEKAAILPDVR